MRRITRTAGGLRTGQFHHNAKLTDHEVAIIRRLHQEGMPGWQIALKFAVTRGYVSKLLRGLLR